MSRRGNSAGSGFIRPPGSKSLGMFESWARTRGCRPRSTATGRAGSSPSIATATPESRRWRSPTRLSSASGLDSGPEGSSQRRVRGRPTAGRRGDRTHPRRMRASRHGRAHGRTIGRLVWSAVSRSISPARLCIANGFPLPNSTKDPPARSASEALHECCGAKRRPFPAFR